MTGGTPDQDEQEMKEMVAATMTADSRPRKIIQADQDNKADRWDEDGDRQNADQQVESYVDDFEAGVTSLTKP